MSGYCGPLTGKMFEQHLAEMNAIQDRLEREAAAQRTVELMVRAVRDREDVSIARRIGP